MRGEFEVWQTAFSASKRYCKTIIVSLDPGVYGVALVAPSVTPYGHINPSFRVFTMEKQHRSIRLLNYTQYHLDLTEANGNI